MEIRIIIDDRIVNAFRRVRRVATGRRLALVAGAAVLGSAVFAVAAPIVKPHDFEAGTPIVAADVNANFDSLYAAFNGRVIREDVTIEVSEDDGCDGLLAELEQLDDFRIGSKATVTIELEPGDYDCTQTIEIAHVNGARLVIAGGGAAPDDVMLTFPTSTTGVQAAFGAVLGGLQNLTLQGDGGSGYGVHVGGSRLRANNVVVRGFNTGFLVQHGGTLLGDDLTSEENGAYGFYVDRGSFARLGNALAANNGTVGFWANSGSMLYLSAPEATENGNQGYLATHASGLYASNPKAIDNGSHGFESSARGTMELVNPTSTGNNGYGLRAASGGYLRRGGTYTHNDSNITAPMFPDTLNAPTDSTSVIVQN